ncbi:MAG TPA: MarP family serine protease [Streptosporangiaceae bacterium]|nr:MarP family serine protease [Streptosporangiaceae bacterium]
MRGDVLDLILIVVVAAFAVSGYRQGFIVGVLSFFGFVGGALLGAEFAPAISRALVGGQTQQDVIAVVLLVSFAVIGQFIASTIGAAMRSTVTWHSATVADSVGGSLVSMASVLLIAWVVGSVLVQSPFPAVDTQVNNSAVLQTLDRFMPTPAKTMFSDFRRLLASNSTYAEVFSGIGAEHLFPIAAPDPAVLGSPGYLAARSRVVKVQGVAPSCARSIEGSGFVISPDHILTNAHVVAGVTARQTVTTESGVTLPATVVYYDPQVDVAILYVPQLGLEPLRFAGPANPGDNAVVAGYPLDAPSLQAAPARIGDVQDAQGPNIYDTSTVTRQIYEIRALVQSGNSGGPLLSPEGTVDGVVFAAAVGVNDTGFALTAAEVSADASAGQNLTAPVSTGGCDN